MRQAKKTPAASPKPAPTLMDAVAVAVATTLIIGMVGCLVFFLVIAFYRGEYDSRLLYIFGLYTAATVLVARIAIDSGRAYANAFSFPLAIVSILAIFRFVTITGPLGPFSWLVNLALLAIAWYLADRITFDCTLISDRQRSSRQGLLQSLGFLKPEGTSLNKPVPNEPTEVSNKKGKHNPGVWVLYFACLAFPLFGLGQLCIPSDEQRGWAFAFLVGYLACALNLLVLTSWLGVRRYLRQRGVSMPAEMSAQWLSVGSGGVLLLLLVCLILPLPGRRFGLVGLPFGFDAPQGLSTNRWGWGSAAPDPSDVQQPNHNGAQADAEAGPPNGPPQAAAQGQPQESDAASSEAKPIGVGKKGKQSPANQHTSQGGSQGNGKDSHDKNEKKAGHQAEPSSSIDEQVDAPERKVDQSTNTERSPESQPKYPSSSSSSAKNPITELINRLNVPLAEIIKWLTIIVLAAIVSIYAITHPREIAKLWREFLEFFAALFGRRRVVNMVPASVETRATRKPLRRPFSAFPNPFASQLSGWTPSQVVEHTFAALEAWGAEHGVHHEEQQTAAEFAKSLAIHAPAVNSHAQAAATMLDQLMFAGWQPTSSELAPLAKLWRVLQARG